MNTFGGKLWTPDEDLLLIQSADKGLSANEIGKSLHRTRHSVIGRAWRIGAWLKKGKTGNQIYGTSSKRRSRTQPQPASSSSASTSASTSPTPSKKLTGLGLRLRGW